MVSLPTSPTLGYSTASLLIKVLVPLAVMVWTLCTIDLSKSQYRDMVRQFRDRKAVFVADFLDNEIDGHFDGAALGKLCAAKQWTSGLIFSCAPAAGGIAMVRNSQLHCIRLAIEIGAELILPEIVRRQVREHAKPAPPVHGQVRGVGLDYLFDVDHLVGALAASCPQMKVHRSLDDLWNVPSLLDPLGIRVSEPGIPVVNGSVLAQPHTWGQQLRGFLELRRPKATRRYPMRIHLNVPALHAWPASADPPELARSFGRLLRVRADARALAASALFNLAGRFHLQLDPRVGHHPESFVGIHLRTEPDVAGDPHFPPYVAQAAYYLDYLVQSRAPVAYLATGATAENVTAFADRALDFNVTVVTKRDILDGPELDLLGAMTWDQRAAVDYEVMLRAGLITGTSLSGFAWNLAVRRAYAFGEGPDAVPAAITPNLQWKDQYSALWGTANAKSNAMRSATWP